MVELPDRAARRVVAYGVALSARRSEYYAWYVVGILYLAAVVSYVDRQIIALMVDDMKTGLGLTDLQIGLLQGPPFGIFYAVMSLPIAIAADKSSRRNIIALGICFWSIATAACGLASSFFQLFFARVGVGVGEAALVPSANSLIGDYFSKTKAALALAVFNMGNLTGIGLAMVLGGLLITKLHIIGPIELPGVGELLPWQLTFVVVGVPGLLLAVLMLSVKEPSRRGDAGYGEGSFTEFSRFVVRNGRVLLALFVSFMLLALIAYANFGWTVEFFVRRFEWAAGDAGLAFGAIVLLFGTAGGLFGGILTNMLIAKGHKDAPYRAAFLCSLPLAPLAVAAYLISPSGGYSLAALAAFQFFGSVPVSLAAASVISICPNRMRAKTLAAYLFFTNIVGMSLGPPSVGFLTTIVFEDDTAIHVALTMVNVVVAPIAAVIIGLAMRPFRNAVVRFEKIEDDHTSSAMSHRVGETAD